MDAFLVKKIIKKMSEHFVYPALASNDWFYTNGTCLNLKKQLQILNNANESLLAFLYVQQNEQLIDT